MAAEPGIQLADIAEPALSTFWPPAPLWWLVAAAVLLLLAFAAKRWSAVRQKQQALRQARLEWAQLSPEQSSELNQLLKRLIKHYQPEHPALSASLVVWQQLLHSLHCEHSRHNEPAPLPDLQALLYHSQPAAELQQQFYQWSGDLLRQLNVKTLEGLCSK